MTPRAAINFFRQTRTGALTLFFLLLLIGYLLIIGFKNPLTKSDRKKADSESTPDVSVKPQLVERVNRAMTAFNAPQEVSPKPTPEPGMVIRKKGDKPVELPPISLYAEPQGKQLEPLSEQYAPYGRLIQCELIVTVDSSSINTPIIGLVTEDVWHDGQLIIPAGTEVHGAAKTDRVRERIASAENWTLVWQTGEELTLSGLALDREKGQQSEGWAITDGSAGLRGQLLKRDDLAEIKLFAATFLSAAASALTEKKQTFFGPQVVPSLQNAPIAGAQQVLDTYAKQILDAIERDGFYVRVPAGKQFYLYVTQTIDKRIAMVGGTRLSNFQTGQEESDSSRLDSQGRVQLIKHSAVPARTSNQLSVNPHSMPPVQP